jgi:hypothetical protein
MVVIQVTFLVFKPGLDIRIFKLWYDSFEEKSINPSIHPSITFIRYAQSKRLENSSEEHLSLKYQLDLFSNCKF